MRKSSEQIGAIAAALAKAQTQLTNPEKTLRGTIRVSNSRDGERSFQYASLASGLDIVRKALGSQEIAVIQTTSVEAKARLIQLTTTIAHSSGEWLASVWPVCPVDEAANPQSLGAALTYARRYALFALVGIAGEDDLDAPEYGNVKRRQGDAAMRGPDSAALSAIQTSGTYNKRDQTKECGSTRTFECAEVALSPDASKEQVGRLLAEVESLRSSEEAAEWARMRMSVKNTLTTNDARLLEARFQTKVMSFGEELFPDLSKEEVQVASLGGEESRAGGDSSQPNSREKAKKRGQQILTPKTIRLRDREHCKFVAGEPCVVCGRSPSDPHHLRFAQPRALSRKVSDEFVVPVCRTHHRELHRYGDEASWWAAVNLDPIPLALELWQRSRTPRSPVEDADRNPIGKLLAQPSEDKKSPQHANGRVRSSS